MLLTPEKTLFIRGATPVLLLAEAPVHDVLPVVVGSPDTAVPRCDGWSIVPKLTMCVVDGPGEAGVVIPSLEASVIAAAADGGGLVPDEMTSWCADAEQAGGAIVLSVDRLPEVLDWASLLGSGKTRGGFMVGLF